MTALRLRCDRDVSSHVKSTRETLDAACAALGRAPQSVLDLGAHVGAFTVQAALRGAFVVAVEADPGNADWLRKNVRDHGVSSRVVIVEAAVAARGGKSRDLVCLKDGQNSLAYAGALASQLRKVSVPTVGLDSVIGLLTDGADVDVLKLDIEGGEWEILADLHALHPINDFRYVDLETHLTNDGIFFEGVPKEQQKTADDVKGLRVTLDNLGFVHEGKSHPLIVRRWR